MSVCRWWWLGNHELDRMASAERFDSVCSQPLNWGLLVLIDFDGHSFTLPRRHRRRCYRVLARHDNDRVPAVGWLVGQDRLACPRMFALDTKHRFGHAGHLSARVYGHHTATNQTFVQCSSELAFWPPHHAHTHTLPSILGRSSTPPPLRPRWMSLAAPTTLARLPGFCLLSSSSITTVHWRPEMVVNR